MGGWGYSPAHSFNPTTRVNIKFPVLSKRQEDYISVSITAFILLSLCFVWDHKLFECKPLCSQILIRHVERRADRMKERCKIETTKNKKNQRIDYSSRDLLVCVADVNTTSVVKKRMYAES